MKKFKYNPNSVYVIANKNTDEIVVINGECERYSVFYTENGRQINRKPFNNSYFAQLLKRDELINDYEIIQEWK